MSKLAEIKKFVESELKITSQLKHEFKSKLMQAEYQGEINAYNAILDEINELSEGE